MHTHTHTHMSDTVLVVLPGHVSRNTNKSRESCTCNKYVNYTSHENYDFQMLCWLSGGSHVTSIRMSHVSQVTHNMGWLRLVGPLKLWVFYNNYSCHKYIWMSHVTKICECVMSRNMNEACESSHKCIWMSNCTHLDLNKYSWGSARFANVQIWRGLDFWNLNKFVSSLKSSCK